MALRRCRSTHGTAGRPGNRGDIASVIVDLCSAGARAGPVEVKALINARDVRYARQKCINVMPSIDWILIEYYALIAIYNWSNSTWGKQLYVYKPVFLNFTDAGLSILT